MAERLSHQRKFAQLENNRKQNSVKKDGENICELFVNSNLMELKGVNTILICEGL